MINIDEDVIYTVTSGHIEHNNWRCWAWFATLDEARAAVEGCGDFIWENYYQYAVIEEVPRGSITREYTEWWYEWSGHEWRSTAKPAPIENLYHFGVG